MPLVFDEQPYDQEHFMRLFQKVLDPSYLEPLRANPESGYEVLVAAAAVGARLSLAATRLEQGSVALYSAGGARAAVPVAFSRAVDLGDMVVLGGTVVEDNQGRQFVLLADVALAGGALTAEGIVQAAATGWEYNVPGPYTTAAGEEVAGQISLVTGLRTLPSFADPTIAVRQLQDAVGGAGAMLDALAEDKLLRRRTGEDDAAVSHRVRTLPDTVSPAAILRLLHALFDPTGLPFEFIETFEHRYQECYDAPSPNPGTPTYQAVPPTNPDYDNRTFVYDDPRVPDIHFRNRTMDDRELRAAFVVVVRRDITLFDIGLAYDDPGMVSTDFHPLSGKPSRGTPAYDLDSTMPPNSVFGSCYDGFDTGRAAIYVAVNNSLQHIRAGGVSAVIDYIRP